MIYWLTGQPGSGKTTLAKWLEAHFAKNVIIIDGDDLRNLSNNKDYSENGRRANISRAQTIAQFLHHKGYNVIVALVSPYRDQREQFKTEMGDNIKECYVHTSNIRGREDFHVIDYEPPLENFIDVNTTDEREFDTIQKLRKQL